MSFEIAGRRVEWRPSTDSTMRVAAELARAGCPSGTVAVADEQTAGIGRHGHSWHSAPGSGLYVSFVLRLPGEASIPLLMLALGLAARQAIQETTGIEADLRWPNDVLLSGRKCAGILAQMEGGAVIAGIGINVSHHSFPEDIREIATSLALEGASVPRQTLLTALAQAVDACCTLPDAEIRARFAAASSYVRGRRVIVDQDAGDITGVTEGLDGSGFLLVRQDNGTVTRILAGGVRPA